MTKVHIFPVRVYYEDTDAGGVVHNTAYVKFAERARTELFRSCIGDQRTVLEKTGLAFAVKDLSVHYLKPAKLDDLLEVHTALSSLKGASFIFDQKILCGRDEYTHVHVRIVCMNIQTGKTARLLPEWIKVFQKFIDKAD